MRHDLDQMLLGSLICHLDRTLGYFQQASYDTPAWFDTGESPGTLHSYRGDYHDLAISRKPPDQKPPTRLALLHELTDADGEYFPGWKGGNFLMDAGTPLWVADWGEATETYIYRVRYLPDILILQTRTVEDV